MTHIGKASKYTTTKTRQRPLIATAITSAVVIAVVTGGSIAASAHNDNGDSTTSSASVQKKSSSDSRWWQDKTNDRRSHDSEKRTAGSSQPYRPTPTTPPATTPPVTTSPVDTPQVTTQPVTTPAVTTPAVAAPAVAAPAQSGTWPTAATTGYPAGTNLKPSDGITVTTDGAVYDGVEFNGDVTIEANNVTIRNSKVNGRIDIRAPYANLLVQRVEIAGPGAGYTTKYPGIGYDNFTADGVNIHGWGDGAMFDSNVTIKNSWIHDIPVSGDSHNQAILSLGGPNFTIVNNRLDAGNEGNFTAALSFLNQWDAFTNTLVQGNLFNGGGYCVYGGGEDKGNAARPSSNVQFLDNTFGSEKNPKCGYYGPVTAFDAGGAGNVWSGNAMANGTAVTAP
ncbi:hypothetical protein E3O42_00100 [Cryobacterium adonitolivorans]|uniref:Right handed beta helix domain-containing protein n=1 Tax=Cryobacterium adonitolivorans TaxID=1259189 RepID=A0A4R8WCV7_9MICO|nr:hypothetical protein [Cryobacterium adonitolivorans]TFC07184.1 hypothetical protein E3O42_00100 [Cryobacterium adonitolivorans]